MLVILTLSPVLAGGLVSVHDSRVMSPEMKKRVEGVLPRR
jgi:hypothetical protein